MDHFLQEYYDGYPRSFALHAGTTRTLPFHGAHRLTALLLDQIEQPVEIDRGVRGPPAGSCRAALGGGVIAAGLGFPAVALAGAASAALGLVAVIVSVRSQSRTRPAALGRPCPNTAATAETIVVDQT